MKKIFILKLVVIFGFSLINPTSLLAKKKDKFNEKDEALFLRSVRSEPSKLVTTVKTNKDPSRVFAAAGILLRNNSIDGVALSAIEFLSKNKRYQNTLIMLMGQSPNVDALCAHFIQRGKEGEKIAASIIASRALGVHLIKKSLIRESKGEKGHNADLEARLAKLRHSDAQIEVPGGNGASHLKQLLTSKSDEVKQISILAAAYLKDISLKEDVLSLKGKKSEINAAVLLYLAMVGEKPEKMFVDEIFKKIKSVKKAINRAGTELSDLSILVPPYVTAIEALGVLADPQYLSYIDKALQYKDIRVQMEALRSVNNIPGSQLNKTIIKMIPKASWPTMVELCNTIATKPDLNAISPLVYRYKKEDGRLRQNILWVLSVIARQPMPANVKQLDSYWKNNTSISIDIDASRAYHQKYPLRTQMLQPYVTTFYSIDVYSDKFVYVVDASKSMNGPKINSLREELTYSIKKITKKGEYNLIDFGGHIHSLYEERLIRDKNTGIKRTEEMDLSIATRSFDSMRRAYSYYDMDEIVFLSDGAPTGYEFKDWNRIRVALQLLNRFRPVKISTIEFGSKGERMAEMKRLADQNYGFFGTVFLEAKEKKKVGKKKKK